MAAIYWTVRYARKIFVQTQVTANHPIWAPIEGNIDFSSTAVIPGQDLSLPVKSNQTDIKKYVLHRANKTERRTGEVHRDKYSSGMGKDRPVTGCKLHGI